MSMKPLTTARLAVLLIGAMAVLFASGCSRGPQFAEVEGVVTLDGQPLPDVAVEFLPDPGKGNFAPHSIAYTDSQGRYKIQCEKAGVGGAAIGIHQVAIRDAAALPDIPGMSAPPLPGQAGKDAQAAAAAIMPPGAAAPAANKPKAPRFPMTYGEPTTTPFRDVEVKPGPQTLNFDIKSGKRRA